MVNQADVVASQLETARKDLLDLGLRNQLLNYHLLRTRGLEVVDELSEEVFRILVHEERTMSFLPGASNGETADLAQPEANDLSQPADRHTDTRLQTALSSSDLQGRLLATYHLANTFIQEQGVNTLFVALGTVTWYESDSSQEARRAPLILIPVELQRTDVRDRFHLRYSGEEVGQNLSLKAKATEFHLVLPDLPESDDLDISQYFDAVEKAIEAESRWVVKRNSVVLAFFSFSKFLMYRDLDVNNWPKEHNPTVHPVLGALLDQGFNEPAVEIDDENLDRHLSTQDVHHVVDADSSQVLALLDVNRGRNLVVQGPPGTGKSQTITNMIAEALGAGKTVLFVSEKMAALNVVKRRLDVVGLGDACLELHSNKTAKKAVLEELSRTISLGRPLLGDIDADSDELARLRDRLNAYSDALRVPIGESGVNPYRALGELILLRQESDGVLLPNLDLRAVPSWTGADYRRRHGVVEELQGRVATMGVPQEHVFWGSRRTSIFPTDLDRLRQDLVAAQESLAAMILTATLLAEAMGLPIPTGPLQAEALCYSARLAIEPPDLKGVCVRSTEWENQMEDLRSLVAAGGELTRLHKEYDHVLVSGAWGQEVLTIREALVAKGRKIWRLLSREYRVAKTKLAGLCSTSPPSGIDTQIRLVNAILAAQGQRTIFERHQTLGERLFGEKWQAESSHWDVLTPIPERVRRINKDVEAGRALSGIIDFLESGRPTINLESCVAAVAQARTVHVALAEAIQEVLDLDVEKRFGSISGLAEQSFDTQSHTMGQWLVGIDYIHEIVSLNNMAEICREEGLDAVLAVAESWPQAGQRLADAFKQAWFEGLLSRAFGERTSLSNFDGASHQQILEKFRALDSQVLEHNQTSLALTHWEGLPRSGTGGQLGILRQQFAKGKGHLPIRRLMEQAGNAVQAIKPVFMMSPLSIANYLAPGSVKFGLVIFDEASQVKPVDAFGAIMRGSQTVVVGDDKQLPPTNFFEAAVQGGGGATEDIESILGLFGAQGAPSKMLRWHYRSRHESLIAVSNQEFYENSLLIFPSPDAGREEVGLRFHHLPNTVYDRGGSSTNVEEAKAVAQAVMDHTRDYPDMTLGVAAFSVAQSQAIQDQLEMVRRQDPSCEGFFNAHPHEPFFVKNLETVQGDERDVILISIGYGRQLNGRIDMDFGPLNRDGGQRRLNVLITRAKYRCEVFTNLTADDIDLGRTRSWGVRALKAYLNYAQHGTLEAPAESGRDSGSPFQDAVASRLSSLGIEIRQEIGSAGYFIDLAVVDPDRPGRYLLGIECDGATYHSSRYARDRDRLRQQVLEGQGWRIHRVWSTDWFRNPERELKRVVEAIESAKSHRPTNQTIDGDQSKIKRADGGVHQDSSSQDVSEYILAELSVSTHGLELHTIPRETMASWVTEVVNVESPVHIQEVGRRIANAAGVAKIGARIQETLLEATRYAARSGEIRVQDQFLWRKDMEQPELRDRSNLANSSRKLELIALEEIAIAVHMVVKVAYGIQQRDVPGLAVRLLGFKRVTEDMRSRVEWVVDQMIVERRLVVQGNLLMVPDRA